VNYVFKRLSINILLFCSLSQCTYHDLNNLVDCGSNSLLVIVEEVDIPTTCSASDGSIKVAAKGGEQPYAFRLNGGDLQEDVQFRDLNGGQYTITVIDSRGCTNEVVTTLQSPDADISFSTSTISDSGCAIGNGSFTIEATGKNSPFQYKFDENAFSSDNTFTGLQHGGYQVTIQDASGCVTTASVIIAKAASNISYAGEIADIIKNSCAVSRCHISGAQTPDLSAYKAVKNYAVSIKSLTTNKFMPPSGSPALTAEQIMKIACWVDDGAKQN
jgi:hypothetical protein